MTNKERTTTDSIKTNSNMMTSDVPACFWCVYVLREVTSSVILDMSVWITFISQAEETRIGREAEALRSAGIERKQPSLGFDSAVSRRDSSPNLARRAAGGLVSGGTPIISLCLRTDGRAGWIFAVKCKLRYRVGCLSNVSRRDTRFVSGRVSYQLNWAINIRSGRETSANTNKTTLAWTRIQER